MAETPRRHIRLEPDPVIEIYKQAVDRTLLRERLKLTPSARLADLAALAAFADELAKAGRRLRGRL